MLLECSRVIMCDQEVVIRYVISESIRNPYLSFGEAFVFRDPPSSSISAFLTSSEWGFSMAASCISFLFNKGVAFADQVHALTTQHTAATYIHTRNWELKLKANAYDIAACCATEKPGIEFRVCRNAVISDGERMPFKSVPTRMLKMIVLIAKPIIPPRIRAWLTTPNARAKNHTISTRFYVSGVKF